MKKMNKILSSKKIKNKVEELKIYNRVLMKDI